MPECLCHFTPTMQLREDLPEGVNQETPGTGDQDNTSPTQTPHIRSDSFGGERAWFSRGEADEEKGAG